MFIVRFLEGRSNKVQSYKNEELIPLESPVDERTTLLESLLIGHDLEKIDQLSSLLVKEKTIQCSLLFQLWNGMVTKENILTDDGKIQKKSNIDLSVTLSESWIHGDSHESTTRSQWDIFRYIEGDTVFSICDLITPWQNNEYILEKIFYELKYLQNEKCKIFANFSQTNSDSLNNIMPLPVEIEDLNVQEWCNLLDKLNQISTSVANVSIPDYSKSICDLNKKQDELTFQFFYLKRRAKLPE
ncbi:uncharacterized protein LOC128884475 [Hylaeus volcanicus]|uniref:uncharacterized protein LOC128884475 n=1 Tax=Hylaeus volcanicus TaxID=313075 RepID=UPI0023B7CDCB|nr:uncharacterized protein LOC128884475 [Hylaeus volcanicus]